VFCRPSQKLTGQEFVTLPLDNWQGAFTVTLWFQVDSFYIPRTFYSRGFDTPAGATWAFQLGHTFLNQLQAQVCTNDGIVEAYGSAFITKSTWHHVACVVDSSLTLYLDGVQVVTKKSSAPISSTNGAFLGRWNNASNLQGNLQEVRVFMGAKDAAWIANEYANFCSSFYTVGAEGEAVLS
jgi:hypothetical protein